MARTLSVVYNPLSFEEVNQPLMMQTQAHYDMLDKYAAQMEKGIQLAKLGYNPEDAEYAAVYQGYIDGMKNSIDLLNKNGLSPNIINGLMNAKRSYATEIAPMEQAFAERERQAKLQQELRLKDPTLFFENDAGSTALKNYMTGNFDALKNNYSGNALKTSVAEAMTNLKKGLESMSVDGNLDEFNKLVVSRSGYTPEEVLAAMNGDTSVDSTRIMNSIIDSTIEASGMTGWSNYDDIKDRARAKAAEGLYYGVGDTKYSTIANERAKAGLSWEYKQREMALSHEYSLAAKQAEYDLKRYNDMIEKGFENGTLTMDENGNIIPVANADGTAKVKRIETKTPYNPQTLLADGPGLVDLSPRGVALEMGLEPIEDLKTKVARGQTSGYKYLLDRADPILRRDNNHAFFDENGWFKSPETYSDAVKKAYAGGYNHQGKRWNIVAQENYDRVTGYIDTAAWKPAEYKTWFNHIMKTPEGEKLKQFASESNVSLETAARALYNDPTYYGKYNVNVLSTQIGQFAIDKADAPANKIQAQAISFGETEDKNAANRILNTNSDGSGTLTLHKIKRVDKDGKMVVDPKNLKLDDYYDKNGNLKYTPTFYYPYTDDVVIIQLGKDRLVVPYSKLGTAAQNEIPMLRSTLHQAISARNGSFAKSKMNETDFSNTNEGITFANAIDQANSNLYDAIATGIHPPKTEMAPYSIETHKKETSKKK